MTPEERIVIKAVIKEAMKEETHEFWIDRETHFRQHEFISSWMLWSDRISNTIVASVVKGIVIFVLGLLALGFAIFGWKK